MQIVEPLKEFFEFSEGAAAKDLARCLGVSRSRLRSLAKGKSRVNAGIAIRASEICGTDAMAILIRQAAKDLNAATRQRSKP